MTGRNLDPTELIDLPEEALRCRTFGHRWDDYIPAAMRRPMYGYRVSFQCVSCETVRHDLINSRGLLLQRQYVYPDYYYMGSSIPPRDDFRQEALRRGEGAVVHYVEGEHLEPEDLMAQAPDEGEG